MRQRAANDLRELRKDLPDVERFGDGMEQADERVYSLAPAQLRRAHGVVDSASVSEVANRFEQFLMLIGERVRASLDVSQTAPCTRAPCLHGADQTRSLASPAPASARRRLRVADEMSCHLDLTGRARRHTA